MKKHNLLGVFLAATVGVAMMASLLLRTFVPRLILPKLDAGAIVALVLIALVLDCYIAGTSKRDYRLIPVYGALIFGLFPFAACITAPVDSLITAAIGLVAFTAVTFLFDSMTERLSSGPVAKAAPIVGAFGMFLAVQCLMGII